VLGGTEHGNASAARQADVRIRAFLGQAFGDGG
jgi:hypothetical protein